MQQSCLKNWVWLELIHQSSYSMFSLAHNKHLRFKLSEYANHESWCYEHYDDICFALASSTLWQLPQCQTDLWSVFQSRWFFVNWIWNHFLTFFWNLFKFVHLGWTNPDEQVWGSPKNKLDSVANSTLPIKHNTHASLVDIYSKLSSISAFSTAKKNSSHFILGFLSR